MLGKILSHFRILSQIGRGGMGVVYRARDERLRRDVAIKILPPELVGNEERRRRFLREARAAAAVNHPNIATIHEIDEADGVVFIAMELIEGKTLRMRLREGSMPLTEVTRVASGIAEGLARAHQVRIIHRDLKPENIIIGTDGHPKILDFGLAKVLEEQEEASRSDLSQADTATAEVTREGKVMGTASYMSPEQARGEAVDHRTDIFSFGTTLYEMATGKVPFRGKTYLDTLSSITRDEPPPARSVNPRVSHDLEEIIKKCLEKDPNDRYRSAQELARNLRNLQAASEISGFGPWISLRRISRRAILATGLVGLLLIAGLTVGGKALMIGFLQPRVRSVAVLPLRNLSDDPDATAHLVAGVSQALITKLGKIANLRVTPWVTAQRYSEDSGLLTDIARDLNVSSLVLGSFRKIGGRIQITVSLVDGKDGFQTWAEEFDEPFSGILITESNIARATARAIVGSLTPEQENILEISPTQNVQAYEFYLKGSNLLQTQDRESTDMAFSYFRKALDLDPNLAEAYLGMGAVESARYLSAWEVGITTLINSEKYFQEAISLNPDLIPAYRGLMRVYWQLGKSEEILKLAKQVREGFSESADTLLARGEALTLGGFSGKAIPIFQKVIEIDPENRAAHWWLPLAAEYALDPEKAVETGDRFLMKFGDDPEIHFHMAINYYDLDQWEESIVHFDRIFRIFPPEMLRLEFYVRASRPYKAIGEDEKADQILKTGLEYFRSMLISYPDNYYGRIFFGLAQSALGDKEAYQKEKEKILADTPNNGFLYANLAWLHYYLGEMEEALEMAHRGAQLGTLWMDFGIFDVIPPDTPGYQTTLRTHTELRNRLADLYLESD